MRKLLGAAALTTMLVLTGCGGGDSTSNEKTTSSSPTESSSDATTPTDATQSTEDSAASGEYCDALTNAKNNLSSIDFTTLDEKAYTQLTGELQNVADVAPSDVQDDWQTVLTALTDLHALLKTAGITFDDLANLSAGKIPPGVDPAELQRIAPKLQKITADGKLQKATTEIQKSAKKDCGLSLN